jgi:hypothetical protein
MNLTESDEDVITSETPPVFLPISEFVTSLVKAKREASSE